MAAAGLISLDHILPEIINDNKIAQLLAQELSKFTQIVVLKERVHITFNSAKLQINMIFFNIPALPF